MKTKITLLFFIIMLSMQPLCSQEVVKTIKSESDISAVKKELTQRVKDKLTKEQAKYNEAKKPMKAPASDLYEKGIKDKKEIPEKKRHIFTPLTPLEKEEATIEVINTASLIEKEDVEEDPAPVFKVMALIKINSKKSIAVLAVGNKQFTIQKSNQILINTDNKTWQYKVIDIDTKGISLLEESTSKIFRIR
jgi:hypothetical protein